LSVAVSTEAFCDISRAATLVHRNLANVRVSRSLKHRLRLRNNVNSSTTNYGHFRGLFFNLVQLDMGH
jgi:hypothetical protein